LVRLAPAILREYSRVTSAPISTFRNKAAVAAIAMPSLTDGGSRFSHDHSSL
jgi:hypothetical protein